MESMSRSIKVKDMSTGKIRGMIRNWALLNYELQLFMIQLHIHTNVLYLYSLHTNCTCKTLFGQSTVSYVIWSKVFIHLTISVQYIYMILLLVFETTGIIISGAGLAQRFDTNHDMTHRRFEHVA